MNDASGPVEDRDPADGTSPEPGTEAFGAEVVTGVVEHMNADHVADMVLICGSFGGLSAVQAARMTGLDRTGGDFEADHTAADGTVVTTQLRVPWSTRLAERQDIRSELVRIVEEAREA